MAHVDPLVASVGAAIAASHPGVEVWDVRVLPAQGLLRVMIEREGGVDHELCAEVSRTLAPFRERYALEVSSPGLERPLLRPEHYARYVGRRAHLRASAPIEGRRTFEGTLLAVGADDVTIALDEGGQATLPLSAIARANLVWTPVTAR